MTRNGTSYAPTELAFRVQDFPNSWLRKDLAHRRAATLALLEFLETAGKGGGFATGDQINEMSAAFDLYVAAAPFEAIIGTQRDLVKDAEMARIWRDDESAWLDEALPDGPPDGIVPEAELNEAREFVRSVAQSLLVPIQDVTRAFRRDRARAGG